MKNQVLFQKAVPVWESGKTREMNQMLAFEVEVRAVGEMLLRIAGYTGYRVFVNGELIHFGPARAGKGFYRVDELPIQADGACKIEVVATGYYCRSFYWMQEPSFLCAELIAGGEVIAYTGDDRWHAYTCPAHLQKVQRYSYQRTFEEVYDYRNYPQSSCREVVLEQTEPKRFIARELTYATLDRLEIRKIIAAGTVEDREKEQYWSSRFSEPNQNADGFWQKELELFPLRMAEKMVLTETNAEKNEKFPCTIFADHYVTADVGGERTGLIELEVECLEDADLFLTFDEILSDGKVDFLRMGCINVVFYRLAAGKSYRLLTAEPYSLGYLNVIARGGAVRLHHLGMRRVGFDTREIVRSLNTAKADDVIARIYHAAQESFCQNTYDVYMDCPSRVRAGWLCDSFFTSRVEYLLTGKCTVEKNFLSNYEMVEHFDGLPEGMLPMCYPSDILNNEYIPNWAMWFILELEEYAARSGDVALVQALKPKANALLSYFRAYENGDGLLQKLDGWIFVEWSRCNKLVQDISYPTNMLYYRFKRALAALYGDESLEREAAALRAVIRQKSRIGEFFCDNAVLDENGVPQLSGEITETCQYYAFFMGVATIEEDAALWKTMVEDFGTARRENNRYPSVHFANSFIGNYLRLELLSGAGYYDLLEKDIRGYFDYMAQKTDTLWENVGSNASCNHGFASHVLIWLERLGYMN